jgi:TonB-dependent SusC/RagA subfamily outer membrane receptor
MTRALATAAVFATPLAAQGFPACNGPGAPFGVTAYRCASCGTTTVKGERPKYVFQSEPVILEVAKGSVLEPGDVIEAVNAQPIMTTAGAEQFAYPPPGTTTISVRRGSSRVQLSATPGCVPGTSYSASADTAAAGDGPLVVVDGRVVKDLSQVDQSTIDQVEVLKGRAAEGLYGPRGANGVVVITTKPTTTIRPNATTPATPKNEPLYVIDGVVQPTAGAAGPELPSIGPRRFGFAIGCLPSCTRAKARDGTDYYKFEAYPPIVAVTGGGPAGLAGLRPGDVVTEIDGKSILGEEGALRFVRANETSTMQVTVQRNGTTVGYVLKAR